MSIVVFRGLGFTPPDLPSTGIEGTLEQAYAELRERCANTFSPDLCTAVLPRNLVYAITRESERPQISGWIWFGLGVVVGKIIF